MSAPVVCDGVFRGGNLPRCDRNQQISQELQAANLRLAQKKEKELKRGLMKSNTKDSSRKPLALSQKGEIQQKPTDQTQQDQSKNNEIASSADAGGRASIVPAATTNDAQGRKEAPDGLVLSALGDGDEEEVRGDSCCCW